MEDIKSYIAKELKKILLEIYNLDIEFVNIMELLESPKDKDNGDIAFPCFKLAKDLRKAPMIIAEEIASKFNLNESISKVAVVSAYINFYVNSDEVANKILNNILNQKDRYGFTNIGNNQNITIDYSSPNIAKPFHLGHLRTTIIGRALYNMYKELGYNVIGINYLGDWGRQFGLVIEGYKRFKEEYDLEKDPLHSLSDMYVRANTLAKNDEKVMDMARDNFKKLEDGEEEYLNLWKYFRELSLKEYNRIYELIKCKFDSYSGESFYSDKIGEVVDILNEKGVLVDSQGAKVVMLGENEPPCIILTSKGSTIYAVRDLAAILDRARQYDYIKNIYVTSYEQIHHFKQTFEVAKHIVDKKYTDGLVHVPYGMVRLKTGKMSTREGTVIYLEDLINDSIKKAEGIIEERKMNIENKQLLAKQIGIGALVFNDLKHYKIKDVVFDLDEVLRFDGETGPYVQYMFARICSILSKSELDIYSMSVNSDYKYNLEETQLLKLLDRFPEIIKNAAENYEPSILTRYIIDVASVFSTYYNNNIILSDDKLVKESRVMIAYAVSIVIKKGMNILGIECPERM